MPRYRFPKFWEMFDAVKSEKVIFTRDFVAFRKKKALFKVCQKYHLLIYQLVKETFIS